jgi:hypothetical protein
MAISLKISQKIGAFSIFSRGLSFSSVASAVTAATYN